ncbi:MAG: biotin-dependent carboxyltransferase family protein [Planctomycetia bacterium]|nr:biotin-dependent carboxyltransferase family protein [Planctomycetia bacterium]
MTLKILRPGTYSILTGPLRLGSMHQGVPRGGPADRHSWIIGNALVGNESGTESDACIALEITLTGPLLQAMQPVTLVLAGSAFDMKLESNRGSRLLQPGHVFEMHEGDILDIAECKQGMRAYLCTPGGFQSTELNGGIVRAPLKPADMLLTHSIARNRFHNRWIEPEVWPDQSPLGTLRMLSGTHCEKKWLQQLLQATFTVSKDSSRMGIRLTTNLKRQQKSDTMLSSPVVPGTLQWPNGGAPILLGVDAQSIGGYPRYGHVVSADMDALGQLKAGEAIRFQLVNLQEAEQLRQSRNRWQQLWVNRLLSMRYP